MSNRNSPIHPLSILLTVFIAILLLISFYPHPAIQADSATGLPGTAAAFFYPSFTTGNTAALNLVDDAAIYTPESTLRLTSATPCCQAGAAWHMTQQNVGNGFETTFDFRISQASGGGADGFTFMIQDDPDGDEAIGGAGCGIGYAGISRSLALEFDTFANPPFCETIGDPNGNHVSVQTAGTGANGPAHANSLGWVAPSFDLNDGNFHSVRIRYQAGSPGTLSIYLDDVDLNAVPALTVSVDLAAALGLTDGMAWVGFTAGTGTTVETHDILNWHFVDEYELTCLDYDFTLYRGGSHYFLAANGAWLGEQRGWGSHNGVLNIHRGITNTGQPILSNDYGDGFDPQLLDLIFDSVDPRPIEAIRLMYEGISGPYTNSTNAAYELKTGSGAILSDNWQFDPTALPVNENGWYIASVAVNDSTATRPTGLRVSLNAGNSSTVLRLKQVGVCIDAGAPPRPPVVPPGAAQACEDLLDNIKTRQQPFGNGVSSQPEFQFPSDVILEPYPEYSLNAPGYLNALEYHDSPAGHALVACVFKQNGQIYNPTTPGEPIVRFTAIGSDHNFRESLTLLNYAGLFSVGSPNWCEAGDNAFSHIYNRVDPNLYQPGYNVPSPKYRCDTGQRTVNGLGPCGSFVGSLYRAMGYYNVDAIANAPSGTPLMSVVGNLYYGVMEYVDALPDNNSSPVNQPFVRVDNSNPTYTPVPVTFSGIRVYPVSGSGERFYGPIGYNPVSCNGEEAGCVAARDAVSGHWARPIEKVLSPHHQGSPGADPEVIWQQIKSGDIAITVIERGEAIPGGVSVPQNDLYTHIQVVVGWGPPAAEYSEAAIRRGFNFFPTYDNSRSDYVPYVMDRFTLPGTGSEAGPRPFSYGLYHTATDFWIASYPPLNLFDSVVNEEAIETLVPTQSFISLTHTESGQGQGPIPPFVSSATAWSPNGNWIAVGGSFGLQLYPADLSQPTTLAGPQSAIVDIAWRPDSTRLATAHAAQRVKIWNPTTGEAVATLGGHTAEMTGVAWSPNGGRIATSGKDGRILLWDGNSYSLLMTLPYTGSHYIHALAWSPNGDRIAGADTSAIYIWQTATGNLLTTIHTTFSPGDSFDWTNDGLSLLTAGPRRWDVATGAEVTVYSSCSAGTDTLVVLSPDGQHLASVGAAETEITACVTELDGSYNEAGQVFLQSHQRAEMVGSLAWSPDSQRVALATQSGWLQVWDAAAGELEATAVRPGVTPTELENMIVACVPNGPLEYALTNQLLAGDYTGFIAQVQSQPPGMIAPGCTEHLVTTAQYLSNNPPLPPTPPAAAQPLTLEAWCSPEPEDYLVWRIQNPNPYEIVVYWGWEEQSPEPGGPPFVVPAAIGSTPSQWLLQTPTQTGASTLTIVSGEFSASAAASTTACSPLWLPLVAR